jgi:ribose/xylose/arabinose/galactoside ABC-type transport system permease subunit
MSDGAELESARPGQGGVGRGLVAGLRLIRLVAASIGAQNLGLVATLVVLVALVWTQAPAILLPTNIQNIGLAVALVGIVAVAQAVVVISGGVDLSVGSVAGLSSVLAALVIADTSSAYLGVATGIAVGAAAGVFNGLVITVGRVNSIIATLATLAAFRGIALVISDGRSIGVFDRTFNAIGSGRVLDIPVPIIILIMTAVVLHVALRYTTFGRAAYAVGGNVVAARLAGISVRWHHIKVFALSGAIAGLAGVVLTARTQAGQPIAGSQGLELDSITAAILGGCVLGGGKGTILGVLIAVVLLGTLTNAMILMNIPSFYQPVAKGGLLIAAVIFQQWRMADGQGR